MSQCRIHFIEKGEKNYTITYRGDIRGARTEDECCGQGVISQGQTEQLTKAPTSKKDLFKAKDHIINLQLSSNCAYKNFKECHELEFCLRLQVDLMGPVSGCNASLTRFYSYPFPSEIKRHLLKLGKKTWSRKYLHPDPHLASMLLRESNNFKHLFFLQRLKNLCYLKNKSESL